MRVRGHPDICPPTSLQPPASHPEPLSPRRKSSAKELTSFAAEAVAVSRQLTWCDKDEEEEAEEEARPVTISATSWAMQLYPLLSPSWWPSSGRSATWSRRWLLGSTW